MISCISYLHIHCIILKCFVHFDKLYDKLFCETFNHYVFTERFDGGHFKLFDGAIFTL